MTPSRREFVVLASAGLMLGRASPAAAMPAGLAQRFLRIDRDGRVTVIAKHLDMGQGIWNGLAAIVAEELDADWSSVSVEAAPARVRDYANTIFKTQTTGGSTSIANSWDELRRAGATARAMLVAAAARRWDVPAGEITVTKGEVRHGRRALGFGPLAALAARETVPADAPLKAKADYRLLGTEIPRLDVAAKTTGGTRFGIDVALPGQKVAVVLRSPRFGGTLRRFDADAARRLSGVVAIVAIPSGIAVIGDTSWHAIRARDAVRADWDDSAAETRSNNAIAADFRTLAETTPGIVATTRGDAAAAIRGAARVVQGDFTFPYLAHAAMEPLCAVGRLSPDGGCHLIGGFQSQTTNQQAVAAVLGIVPDRVTLETVFAGGSFGRRASFTSDWVVELAEILKATQGRWPIKLLWTRDDDIRGGYYRPLNWHRLRAGLTADGRIAGIDQSIVGQSILFGQPTGEADPPKADFTGIMGSFVEEYDVADARLRWFAPRAKVPVHTYRSIGNTHTALSKEVFMDRLARTAGIDPVAFRLAHLGNAPRQAAVLKRAASEAGWGTPLPAGRTRGVAVHASEGSFTAQVAEITQGSDPADFRIDRVTCAIDCGIALDPANIRNQVEGGIGFGLSTAMIQELRLEEGGQVIQDNFDSYPILRMADMPRRIDVHIIEGGERPTGVGEPGSVPIGAALANALALAQHREIDRFPLRPQGPA